MYIYKRICTWGILSIVREASEKRGYPVANNDDDYVGRFLGFFFGGIVSEGAVGWIYPGFR